MICNNSKKSHVALMKEYESVMRTFKTNFTREELKSFGAKKTMRTIPQILRLWVSLNHNTMSLTPNGTVSAFHRVGMNEMMDAYAHMGNSDNQITWSPLLQKLKRQICSDKETYLKEIQSTKEQLLGGRFHFYNLSYPEQLYVGGPERI